MGSEQKSCTPLMLAIYSCVFCKPVNTSCCHWCHESRTGRTSTKSFLMRCFWSITRSASPADAQLVDTSTFTCTREPHLRHLAVTVDSMAAFIRKLEVLCQHLRQTKGISNGSRMDARAVEETLKPKEKTLPRHLAGAQPQPGAGLQVAPHLRGMRAAEHQDLRPGSSVTL